MEETVPNPISVKARGQIYVGGAIVAGVMMVATTVITILGLTEWLALPASISSAYLFVAATLGRSNLGGSAVPVASISVIEAPAEQSDSGIDAPVYETRRARREAQERAL